jgi:hypothetical protein
MIRSRIGIALIVSLAVVATGTAAGAQPANDACAAATSVAALPFNDPALDTTTATLDAADPVLSCTGAIGENSVWYSVVAPAGVDTIDIDTTDTDYPAAIGVFTGGCGTLTEIACYHDPYEDARIPIGIPAGGSFYVQISDPDGSGGSLELNLREPRFDLGEVRNIDAYATTTDPLPTGAAASFVERAAVLNKKLVGYSAVTNAVLVKQNAAILSVAAAGDPAPGGGTFRTFSQPSLGTITSVAFWAGLDDPAGTAQGIYYWDNVGVIRVVGTGDVGPAGEIFSHFTRYVSANGNGDIAFFARPSIYVWNAASGMITNYVSEGDANPCGGTFRSIGSSDGGFALNDAGEVAFYAESPGADGVFFTNGGAPMAYACEGGAAPLPLGGLYDRFGRNLDLNGLGDVIFQSRVDVGGTPTEAVLFGAVGGVGVAAAEGTLAASGQMFVGLDDRIAPSINDNGDAVFAARTGAGDAVAFLPAAGPPAGIYAEDGMACPGGGIINAIDDETHINPVSDVTFVARCDAGQGFGVFSGSPPAAFGPEFNENTATPIGPSMRARSPNIDTGGDTSFLASRSGIYLERCANGVCNPAQLAASEGQAVPGAPARTISTIFSSSLTGTVKQLGFLATSRGPAGGTDELLVAAKGSLFRVASTGDPLPGGVGTFSPVVLTDDFSPDARFAMSSTKKSLAFVGGTAGVGGASAIFLSKGASLAPIVTEGSPSPNGGIYASFSTPSAYGRRIAFLADIGPSNCLFLARGTAGVQTILCEGNPLPPVGAVLDAFLGPPALAGKRASFIGSFNGGTDACVFMFDKNQIIDIVCTGDPAPGGGTITSVSESYASSDYHLVADGRGVAFNATVDDTRSAVLAWRKGKLAELARDEGAAPASVGGTYTLAGTGLGMRGRVVAFDTGLIGGTKGGAVVVGAIR